MRDALAQKTQLFLARTQANVDRDLAQPPEQVIEPVLPGIGHRDDHGIERLEACARNQLVEIAVAVPASRGTAARLCGIGENARDRKSVVKGKSGSVRVDCSGRRILKKKKN